MHTYTLATLRRHNTASLACRTPFVNSTHACQACKRANSTFTVGVEFLRYMDEHPTSFLVDASNCETITLDSAY